MITDVEELRQPLEKNKKELVEVIEGLIQHTANGHKDAILAFALATMDTVKLLPRTDASKTLP